MTHPNVTKFKTFFSHIYSTLNEELERRLLFPWILSSSFLTLLPWSVSKPDPHFLEQINFVDSVPCKDRLVKAILKQKKRHISFYYRSIYCLIRNIFSLSLVLLNFYVFIFIYKTNISKVLWGSLQINQGRLHGVGCS